MPDRIKTKHVQRLAAYSGGLIRIAAALAWIGMLASLTPVASAQSPMPKADAEPDRESEPDLAGLLAAITDLRMEEPLPGLTVGAADYAAYGIRIHVFDFTKANFQITLAEQKASTGSHATDFLEAKDDVFVINGGFFERDRADRLSPSGLLIVDGNMVAEEHDRAGSGVIYAGENGVAIAYRKDLSDRSKMRDAVQVGPILVDPGGVKGIYKNVPERHNRSAICLRGTSFTAFVVEGGISLFQLADLLSLPPASGGFGCDVAINLDGGPSTQAVLSAGTTRRGIGGGTTAQNFIVVSRKPAP